MIIDARSDDVYNGWAIDGNKRGGHLPNATNFPSNWLDCEYDEENNPEGRSREEVLNLALNDKGIDRTKELLIYDTNDQDAIKVANYLLSKGYENIKTYNASEWIEDETKPLESYENYPLLVAPSIVHSIIQGEIPDNFTLSKDIKIIDIRLGDSKESGYEDAHIETAIYIDANSFESPFTNSELEQLLLKNGIHSEDCLIMTSPEPMAASRFAVICQYMGVKDVRVMNGGFVEWFSRGYKLEKGLNIAKPISSFGIEAPASSELIISLEEMKNLVSDKNKLENFTLVDNRTWFEFERGRIPIAIYGHAGIRELTSMSYYRNINKTMRNEKEIKELWKSYDIDIRNHLCFMCQGGWRAAEVLWYAQVMGLSDVSLFSDGWAAWVY